MEASSRLAPITRCLVVALAAVPAFIKWTCYPHNIGSDDAYIHLRIATNFVHGRQWGINPHQPVNLSTSPAFTLLLAAAELVTRHAVGLTQLLSCLAVAAGLVWIFQAARAETRSGAAAFFALVAAAFSVNLWRWNGALMEASFAFAVVAALLYHFRRSAPSSQKHAAMAGLLLGTGILLRPEMGLLAVLAIATEWLRTPPNLSRASRITCMLLGMAVILTPWSLFAWHEVGSIVPTTFAAKSATHLIFWNGKILQQFGESLVESLFFPAVLVALLLALRFAKSFRPRDLDAFHPERRPPLTPALDAPTSLLLPVGWVLGLFCFYYLKTPGLQSAGRYLLPLLPCEALLLAVAWERLAATLRGVVGRLTLAFVALHVIFALALNALFVTPVLRRFEGEYGATMRAAANELATRVAAGPNRRVLVVEDIGVLSYAADGHFQIFDGGALATPALHGLSLRQQIEQVHPAFVLESLAPTADGFGPVFADQLSAVWERRFRQHSVRKAQPFYYAILYQDKGTDRAFISRPAGTGENQP